MDVEHIILDRINDLERRITVAEKGGCECRAPIWAFAGGGSIPCYRCSHCDAVMTMPMARKHLPKRGR